MTKELLEKFENVVTELKNTNSANDKVKILRKYINDGEICKLFMYTYNPFYKYGVTSANLKKNAELTDLTFDEIFDLFDKLRNRELTGNKAIATVNGFINQNLDHAELLYDIFDRKLNVGMAVKQINKALGNIIPVFDVALAATYDEEWKDKYGLENYHIQRKMNGTRLVTILTFNKATNTVEAKCYSRKGIEFTTCDKIKEELISFYNKSKYVGQDLVFDGECCLIDKDGKEDWNGIISEIKRKNFTMQHPKYTIFDFLTLEEFSGIKPSHDYLWRRDKMLRLFFGFGEGQKFKYLDVIFSVPYSEEAKNKLLKQYVETDKWEGLIFRKNCSYKSGRSKDLIKFKLFKDEEFRVIDIERTEKPMLVDGKMVMTKCVGSLMFKLKNNNICYVGSGISDEQRIEWYNDPSKIIGKQICVKYKEMTKNSKTGEYSLQFPTLLHVYEEDRDF